MAQQGEINQNQITQGLFTEGSPLNFPAGATVRDENFIINTDGSRERRLGIGLESGYVSQGNFFLDDRTFVFDWDAVGNDGNKNYAVVFNEGNLLFYDKAFEPLSSGLKKSFSKTYPITGTQISATNINGELVVVGLFGDEVQVFYEDAGDINQRSYALEVRDIWGVDEEFPVEFRPRDLSKRHAYNLANQGWKFEWANDVRTRFDNPEVDFTGVDDFIEFVDETIEGSFNQGWPSNADVPSYGIGTNSDGSESRFYPALYDDVPFGSTPSAKGSCVTELTNMGPKRLEYAKKNKGYGTNVSLASLSDSNLTGPSACASYAGRVFYSGFVNSGGAVNDTYPDLTSMVAFSQSVYKDTDVRKCYQQADPADEEGDIVASDGGTLQIAGTGFIYKLLPVGRSLIVFAAEGVWEIYSTDQLFSATNYQIRKLTDVGCKNPNAVIVVESIPMYWTDYGIYALQPDQVSQSFVATNITAGTIQTYYDNIEGISIRRASGFYDKFDKKARWLFSSDGDNPNKLDTELVFDSRLQSWYTNVYPVISDITLAGMVSLNIFSEVISDSNVVVNSDNVLAGTDQVVVEDQLPQKGRRSYKYIAKNTATDKYEFYEFNQADFKDFGTADAEAVMITGPYTGGDSVRRKNSTYLTMQLRKTELGFQDIGGSLVPINPGSCIVQVQWDWTDLAKAGKFTTAIEMYRHRRHYFPANVNDEYEDGNTVITTKSRLRGSGRSLALKITSSPEKDCNILGWNFQVSQNDKV